MTVEMVEVKTVDLVGPALDWAAAVAIGRPVYVVDGLPADGHACLICCSTDWAQGGPLIDEYKIELLHFGETYGGWNAQLSPGNSHYIDQGPGEGQGEGSTALIAACRAIVRAKLGETVSVPAELVRG